MFDKTGLGIGIFAVFANIVATALPNWFRIKFGQGQIMFGLWQICFQQLQESEDMCFPVDDMFSLTFQFKVVRGLEIVGILISIVAQVLGSIKICMKKKNRLYMYFGCLSNVLAGIIICSGAFTFINDNKLKKFLDRNAAELEYSKPYIGIGLCTSAGVTNIIAGGLFFVAARKL